MSKEYVDVSDPACAARVNWAAAVLFARVSGMNAENQARAHRGEHPAFGHEDYYDKAVADALEIANGVDASDRPTAIDDHFGREIEGIAGLSIRGGGR